MNTKELLKLSPLFHSADPEIIESLALQCHKKSLPKGHDLFAVGDSALSFFLVVSGWIKLYRVSRDGNETIVHIFGPGESFAEAAVFNETKTYPVNAQAVEAAEVIEIPKCALLEEIEKHSYFALQILGAIAARQHYLIQQLEQVTTRTAPQRIGAFLLRFCQKNDPVGKNMIAIELPYDKSVISTRLNIKPETFSRALSKLSDHGLKLVDKKIIITDVVELARFCDIPLYQIPCRNK